MSSEQEAILRFGIEIEKMLCEKLGKQWRPSGMSIESLVEEMSAMVKPNDVPPIPEGHPHVYPVNPAPVWKIPMMQSDIDLRDWFAGMAMQGLCGSDVWPNDANIPYIAKLSYEMADEMIKAREAK